MHATLLKLLYVISYRYDTTVAQHMAITQKTCFFLVNHVEVIMRNYSQNKGPIIIQ